MNIVAYNPNTALPSRASQPAPSEAPPQQASGQEDKVSFGSVVGRGAAGLGGAAVGYLGAQAATAGVQTVAFSGLIPLMMASLPALQISPGLAQALNTGLALGIIGGGLLGTAAAVATGGAVAFHAAAGAEKTDPALDSGENKAKGAFSRWNADAQESGAELRAQLRSVGSAESFGQAVKSGAFAGASLGGPVGATAGKYQGMLLGAAAGAVASLPLVAALAPLGSVPGYVAMGVIGLAGAGIGAKVGEPVGHVVGSVMGGAVGAAGAGLYHGVRSLAG